MAHQTLVKALSGQNGAISVSNGQVIIDLAPFIAIVKQDLAARGFTLVNSLPPIHPTLALFSAKNLVQAQTLYRLINDLKIVLPILSLLLIAAGVYIARGHRRALIGAGLGFAASMLVLGAALLIVRGVYLQQRAQRRAAQRRRRRHVRHAGPVHQGGAARAAGRRADRRRSARS